VQANLSTLRSRGVHVVPPEEGRLAGGDVGAGRLAEPEQIVTAALALVSPDRSLAGRTVLVTAGGTREAIDPVRYLGNRSSGKMGHAIANIAAARGARVILVTTATQPVEGRVEVVAVESAEEMHDAVAAHAIAADVIVMAAAVADFRPKSVAPSKLKKGDGPPELLLEPTVDILATLGAAKPAGQVIVGFAAETERLREHAAAKLAAKRVDLMVANDVSAADAGFAVDTNRALLLGADGTVDETGLLTKDALAGLVLDRIVRLLDRRRGDPST
jgi:phosphopantothenoylcysteine decarboxylase/phosphopantothenate--cysteine ligase